MRWYVNDVSLQGQFPTDVHFLEEFRGLLRLRARTEILRTGLFSSRNFREKLACPNVRVREVVQRSNDADFRRSVLSWLDRYGPFTEDERLAESEDYFEFGGIDVTDTGLGEAARRTKARQDVETFSFAGGHVAFDLTPLAVDHGVDGDRLGQYQIKNLWTLDQLANSAIDCEPPATSWRELVESARRRFTFLTIPDSIYEDARLAREPFDAAIRDRTLALLGHLNLYMSDRRVGGAEGPIARGVIDNFFTGEMALFTGESASNRRDFAQELTFPNPDEAGRLVDAHWHGKISRRYFRLHFEWPVPADAIRLKVAYLGPKLTKS